MPAEWKINYWPRCQKHVFLSHCAEDRDELVAPVYRELERRKVIPWIDRHHYPAATDAFEALREELLKCRHIVYFITPASLQQGRGWVSAERALSATIQQRLRYADQELAHFELPLLFVSPMDPVFHRSVWRALIDKASHCPFPPAEGPHLWSERHVEWTADQIENFIRQEDRWAVELRSRYRRDSQLSHQFGYDRNLLVRLLRWNPLPPK